MNFAVSDEQAALAATLARFAADRYRAAQRDTYRERTIGYDPAVWRELAELGLIDLALPREAGGLGGGTSDMMVAMQALGPALLLEPWLPALVGARLVAAHGTTAQQQHWVRPLASGVACIALALTEAGTGHPLARIQTRAERAGPGYRLFGEKRAVIGAGAETMLVTASMEGEGIGLFLVPADTPGVSIRAYRAVDGSLLRDIVLDGCVTASDCLVGDVDHGTAMLEDAFAYASLALCAEAIGIMDAAVGQTIAYLQTRRQFGATLSSFQAIQHRMADCVTELELARGVTMRAASLGDDPDAARTEKLRACFGAKALVSVVALLVAEETVQFHGATGITEELWIGRAMKRLVMIAALFGDARAQIDWSDRAREAA